VRIAIASGRGSTDKATLAVNLAALLSTERWGVRLLDTDVEEPDWHLFLKPSTGLREPVAVLVPDIDHDPSVTHTQVAGVDVPTYGGPATTEIRDLWEAVSELLLASSKGRVSDA
jgi:Mrp family chromosome partitioning ATPase